MDEGALQASASSLTGSEEPMEQVTTSTSSHDEDPHLRVLRKGDLVRISAGPKTKLEKRDGALAKVTKTIPIPQSELDEIDSPYPVDKHPFRYNMDFVLGGRGNNIHRRELVYTTATAEGMISESGERSRRKRKPSSVALEAKDEAAKPAKKKPSATKKKGAGAGGKRKVGISKVTGNDGKRAKQVAEKQSTNGPHAQDLYVKHHREFERMATRVEKTDQFGFFFDAPSEPSTPMKSKQNATTVPDIQPPSSSSVLTPPNVTADTTTATTPTSDTTGKIEERPVDPFAKPPQTWYDIRKRREAGRYVLDRIKLSEEERRKRLQPYKSWKRKQGKGFAKKTKSKGRKGGTHPRVLHAKGVHWDLYCSDVMAMCNGALKRDAEHGKGGSGTLGHAALKIMDEIDKMNERTGKRQKLEMEQSDARHEFSQAIQAEPNQEAAMQVEWRTIPFPERKYERLSSDVICAGLSAVDAISSSYEMQTTLEDSFVGISYKYNDNGQSEGWMKSVLDESMNVGHESSKDARQTAEALRNDGGVVKAQVQSCMQSLLIAVQDKVMTDAGVVKHRELRSANWEGNGPDDVSDDETDPAKEEKGEPELVEQSVWGIDCYTRRNVVICLETEFEEELALEFIEKWLLPAINACPEDLAHDLTNAAKLLEGLKLRDNSSSATEVQTKGDDRDEQWSHSLIGQALLTKIRRTGPPWLKVAANHLRRGIAALGNDFFRVHPKGHGSIVLSPKLKANTLVTFYRGEVYPSWRWGEKMDAIDMTQERLGLRPNLPDFYNMALERPQADPRGYGLMIVDGSRKAGHGSMLSHSCQPTCEVRVAARNGELCLAMTTLRELEQGEELTFDYNAVTESLNEYQAAVCLCGFRGCRGSFLHFATADCYQQVLNRNSPIAVRFSNLLKGCMKKVMAADDEEVLKNHGFGTAAFGAVSLNRHISIGAGSNRRDSMDAVPVWLRTYVADTLRYIEYERRALPIALLCDHVETKKTSTTKKESAKVDSTTPRPKKKELKPENVFMFYARHRADELKAIVARKQPAEAETMTPEAHARSGITQRHEVLRMASAEWKELSGEEKAKWKEKSLEDYRRRKEQDPSDAKEVPKEKQEKLKTKTDKSKATKKGEINFSKISFEAADAEGVSAMEQRIQQLTQGLSRVGRVLDRHRESALASTGFLSSTSNIPPPISMVDEDRIVQWLWRDTTGPAESLIRALAKAEYCSASIRESILDVKRKCDTKLRDSSVQKRETVSFAFLEMREALQSYVFQFVEDKRRYDLLRAKQRRDAAKKKREEEERIKLLSQEASSLVGEVQTAGTGLPVSPGTEKSTEPIRRDPRFDHFRQRWKLEAAADLLLFYAHTSTFLTVNPYNRLESTPVEVYARELGNAVPRSVIESSAESDGISGGVVIVSRESDEERSCDGETAPTKERPSSKKGDLCEPDDIITNVTVSYEGDYVVSQLLQWYNGGIGQKAGLPNMLGCCVLPSLSECFSSTYSKGGNSKMETSYSSEIRPLLTSWFEDVHQRGSPFPDEAQAVFSNSTKSDDFFPIGSPVLDLLIMGDDMNLNMVMAALSENVNSSLKSTSEDKSKTAKDRLQSTVDEGMPAQAVANWVQCENPKCLKWRKLPWHVDLDLLPEQFFCKDNIWNPKANSCDSHEDEWDEYDSQIRGGGVEKDTDASMMASLASESQGCNGVLNKDFVLGAKFDILRPKQKKFFHAEVKQVTRIAGGRRVLVHYAKTPAKFDEWLDLPCDRIFPFNSKVTKELKKEKVVLEKGQKPLTDSVNTLKTSQEKKAPAETRKPLDSSLPKEDQQQETPVSLSKESPKTVTSDDALNISSAVVAPAKEHASIPKDVPPKKKKKATRKEDGSVKKRLAKLGQGVIDRSVVQSRKKDSGFVGKASRNDSSIPRKKLKQANPPKEKKTARPGSIPRKSSSSADTQQRSSLLASIIPSSNGPPSSPANGERPSIFGASKHQDQVPRKRSPQVEKSAVSRSSDLLNSVTAPNRSPRNLNQGRYEQDMHHRNNICPPSHRFSHPPGRPHFDRRPPQHDQHDYRNGSFYDNRRGPGSPNTNGFYRRGNPPTGRTEGRYRDMEHASSSKSHPFSGQRFYRKDNDR